MLLSPVEVAALIQRARNNDQDAIRTIVHRWDDPLRRVIRRHLHELTRSLNDSADIMQYVWIVFFGHVIHREDIQAEEQLLACLAGIARNKAHEANRNELQTEKRCRLRVVPLEADLADHGAAPEQLVQVEEEWQRLLEKLPSEWQCALQLLREGATQEEAAQGAGVPRRTFSRVLEQARRWWAGLGANRNTD